VVAGITVNVYSYVDLQEKGRHLAVLFLLHGRHGSTNTVERVVNGVLGYAQSQGPSDRDLVVVTFVSDDDLYRLHADFSST
jgi:hypothetical protein